MFKHFLDFWTRDMLIIGGSRGRAPPAPSSQRDPILSFSQKFLPKSTRIGGRRPPMARRPPHGKSWIRNCLSMVLVLIVRSLTGRDSKIYTPQSVQNTKFVVFKHFVRKDSAVCRSSSVLSNQPSLSLNSFEKSRSREIWQISTRRDLKSS